MNVNKLELRQMQDYARKIGVKFRYDPLINPRLDGSKGPLSFRLTPEEVVAGDMRDEKRKHEWKQFYEYSSEALDSESLYPCGAGRSSFVIDPYGNLSVCMIARKPSYDLNKGSFSKGWNEFIPREILNLKHPLDGECAKCIYAHVCDYCPGWAQLERGEAVSGRPIEFLCQITRQRLKAFGLKRRYVYERKFKESLSKAFS
jgi:radical SAM protein with 4Fe4S-binding SPASM domain